MCIVMDVHPGNTNRVSSRDIKRSVTLTDSSNRNLNLNELINLLLDKFNGAEL